MASVSSSFLSPLSATKEMLESWKHSIFLRWVKRVIRAPRTGNYYQNSILLVSWVTVERIIPEGSEWMGSVSGMMSEHDGSLCDCHGLLPILIATSVSCTPLAPVTHSLRSFHRDRPEASPISGRNDRHGKEGPCD